MVVSGEAMFEAVLLEIKQIDFDKIKNGQSIHKLLTNHEFEKAFYLACLHCRMDDDEALKLIKILVLHCRNLGIDLNLNQYARSALRLAADNDNINLYYELVTAGAEDAEAGRIMAMKQRKASASFDKHYRPEFLQEYASLKNQPLNHYTTDAKRVLYVIKLIDFLIKYHTLEARFKKMPKNISSLAMQAIKDTRDEQNRILIQKMCSVIQQLSPDLRKRFDKALEASSFNWLSFEHLGGIMIEPSMQKAALVPVIGQKTTSPDRVNIDSAFHLIAEVGDLQLMIPHAALTIIEKDLPTLRNFFHALAVTLIAPDKPITVPRPEFAASKCIITYFNDIQSLIKLLNLSHDSTARMKLPLWPESEAPSIQLLNLRSGYDVSKKVERHAALRRLQSLGELITGKNFSKFLIDLDPTTDWRAFIVIRDAITHQDERDLKYRIEQFLGDNGLLQQVFAQDMHTLGMKLNQLIWLREQSLGKYTHDPASYWQHLLKREAVSLQKKGDGGNNNNNDSGKQEVDTPDQAAAQKHVLSASEKEFIHYLEQFKAAKDIIELSLAIFAGQAGAVSKMQKGMILQCLPRKELGEKYKELSTLLDNAIAKPSTLADREKKRLDEKAASEKREADRESKFDGLEGIRKLAKYLLEPVNKEHQLNPLKRIEATLESLSDIEEFLIEEGYWTDSPFFNTIAEWEADLLDQGSEPLSNFLVKNPKLNDALEYHIGQILQHLETIKTYKELAVCPLIANGYSDLRVFRNYLEHGNPLVDNQNDIYLQQDYREKKTADMVIRLLIELKPALKREKMRKETEKANAKELHPGVLVTAKENEEWTKVCGHGNLFFAPQVKSAEKGKSRRATIELPGVVFK
ncbi:hypothetical protein DIZ81_13870 [Legionella taurinensis]|uniref:Ankyrin repeat domain-containing protein n=2 Tax=Legionella taurinensis TaxID=70611 RepID=A0AB38N2U2_9GAMM|nr:hypothetical protein DB744_13880 [Legionella taurinensis]PUT39334.1 hypothetical protein DB746_13910 [Legionella taurinensis]PUT44488.1 hypothetical protein DB745_13910 [Legionella taurinensis]TID32210.1 hypothetical protein DIZ42_13880 [Legionella taurinensis]TID39758.1 hypothetical protein DIZ81_13870 [Legionella taurinensis]